MFLAAAAIYAALVPQATPQRASALVNPAEDLTYSSALTTNPVGKAVKSVTITEAGVSITSDFNTTTLDDDDNQPFLSAGLAADNPSAGLLDAETSLTSEVLASGGADETIAVEDDDRSIEERSAVALSRIGCDTSVSDIYCVYEVQQGDTLSSIAAQFGLEHIYDEDDLLVVENWELLVQSNKPDIVSEDDFIVPGQKLRIPRGNGAIHTVLDTETLFEIADAHGVAIEDIMAENGIGDADIITIGSEILIPNPIRFRPPSAGDGGLLAAEIVSGGASSGSGFIWPVAGPISSYFSPGHPLGIDIDLYANEGVPVGAAKAGTVTFAGGNPCCSYGYYVVIDHGDGFSTLYAHFSGIAVVQGQYVEAGQLIGYGGSTGYSTGTHLHFEVKYQGSILDPLGYLP
jgi:murein DD-endopeptidase MepM/ murein hydrolase activator NlpD